MFLSWTDASADEDGVTVERRLPSETFASVAQVGSDVTTFVDGSVPPQTFVEYRVRAFRVVGGASGASNVVGVTTPGPPARPLQLAGVGVSPTRVDLSWVDASSDEDGFTVQRRPTGAGAGGYANVAVLDSNVAAWSDPGVSAEASYDYRVLAFSLAGSSAPSDEVTVVTPPPSRPAALTAVVRGSPTRVELSWSDTSTIEHGFRVERRLLGQSTYASVASVASNVTTLTDGAVTLGQSYEYQVIAEHPGADSGPSPSLTVSVVPPPEALFTSSPTSVEGCVDLPWVAIEGAGRRVDAIVEVDPTGTGAWRRATQGASDPGAGIAGVSSVAASAVGVAHVFRWDSAADVPGDAAGVRLRISARTGATRGPPDERGPFAVTNAPRGVVVTATSAGASPVRGAVGDLDRDGVLDVVVVGADGDVRVLRGDGAGALGAIAMATVTTADAQGLALADVDRDGDLDAIVALPTDQAVALLRNDGTGTLGAPTTTAVGRAPHEVEVADLDRDGDLDVVLACGATGEVVVLTNDGAGALTLGTVVVVGGRPTALATGDLNHDARLDVVVSLATTDAVAVLLGQGNGALAAPSTYALGGAGGPLAIGDVDRDGRPDVVVGLTSTAEVALLRGQAGGALAAATRYAVGGAPTAVHLDDADADGDLDVLVNRSDRVVRLAGDGAGDLAAAVDHAPVGGVHVAAGDLDRDGERDLVLVGAPGATPVLLRRGRRCSRPFVGEGVGVERCHTVATGDLNGDGKLDVVASSGLGDRVTWALGRGDGTFARGGSVVIGGRPTDVLVADLDRDGAADAVLACNLDDTVTILWGRGDGTFDAPPQVLAVGDQPAVLTAGDLDGDGRLDVVCANRTGTVSVLVATGSRTFAPAATIPVGGVLYDVALADLQGDGALDLIVADNSRSLVVVRHGDGAGSFGPPAEYAAGSVGPARIDAVDVDADGVLDVVVAFDTQHLYLLSGAAGSGFAAPRRVGGLVPGPRRFLVDLDGDGDLDAVGRSHMALGDGTGAFPTNVVFRLPEDLLPAAVGEFTGDDVPDLVASHFGGLAVFRGRGDGSLADVAPRVDAGLHPAPGVLVDLDRDGDLDLAIAYVSQSPAEVGVYPGQSGVLGPEQFPQAAVSIQPTAVRAGDLDRDGDLDLAVAGTHWVRLLFGTGGLTFPTGRNESSGVRDVQLADMDRDGVLDLVVARPTDGRVDLLRGRGDETFEAAVGAIVGGTPGDLVLGDLDRDGDLDVIATSGPAPAEIITALNTGGAFTIGAMFSLPAPPGGVAATDVDRDGRIDVVVTCPSVGALIVARGRGDGTFDPAVSMAVVGAPNQLVMADVNADGWPDAIIADVELSVVHVVQGPLLGTTPRTSAIVVYIPSAEPILGDIDRDGAPDLVNGGDRSVYVHKRR